MPISIQHFETLAQRFPTWDELRTHLESPAGGSLRCIPGAAASRYAILRYTRGATSAAAATELFRSVIWDTQANRPVSMAPPKAREGLPPLGIQLASTEDFIDGFMVNVAIANGDMLVATRTQIGGTNSFYAGAKSFGDMFDEALLTTPLKNRAALQQALESVGSSAFASFVVQHPDHRVVAKISTPALYIVHVGSVAAESGAVSLLEKPSEWPTALARLQIPSYPLRLFRTEQDVQDMLRKTAVQRGWRWQGLVFKDGTGARWRLRTPTYSLLRELRGSESSIAERFLRLRAEGKVLEYLKHYGEDRQAFWQMEQDLRARTADVLTAYSDVHKAHAVAFKDLPEAYRPAVFALHVEWLNTLRPKGYKVRLQNAIAAVNGLRAFEQKRLMSAEPYVAAAAPAAPAKSEEEGVDTPAVVADAAATSTA